MKMHLATIPAEVLRQKPRTVYYTGQRRLLAAMIIILAILPLVFISWNSSKLYQESWLTKTAEEISGSARNRKELIEVFLADQEDLLASVVALQSLKTVSEEQNLERIYRVINVKGVMVDLGVIDAAGNHLSYVGPYRDKLAGKNYADAPWFKETMKQGRYISDIFSGYRGVPHLVVAVAAADRSWILRATINSVRFDALLANTNVGPNGDAYIISRQGEFQTSSRQGQRRLTPETITMLQGMATSGAAREVNNGLYAVAALNEDKWLLVLQTDIASSLKDFYNAKKIGLSVITGTAIMILIVAQFLIRSLVNRIAQAEDQRMVLTDKVREVEKMALIGRLAASVAHEINNPLQVISAQAGWVKELLDLGPEGQAANHEEHLLAIAKIRDQVKRAGNITKRLLGFSRRQEAGSGSVADLNQSVEETIVLLEKEARSNRIKIERQYQPDLPAIKTDAAQLQQVFLNILNNAIDAIGHDGAIRVSTGARDRELLVEFADTGPGIPADCLEQVFSPFFTTKEKGKGTGLGLAISKNIMQRLGGDLQVANQEQGGCRFTVSVKSI